MAEKTKAHVSQQDAACLPSAALPEVLAPLKHSSDHLLVHTGTHPPTYPHTHTLTRGPWAGGNR